MKIIVIFGPTASGKTKAAFSLAQQYSAPLISVDSRKAYKELDIGTNKRELLLFSQASNLPVFGINLFDPDELISVADFRQKLTKQISGLQVNGLILFGGTGLYLDGLLFGLPFGNSSKNRHLLEKKSLSELQNILSEEYPHVSTMLNNSELNNTRRLIRAIEKETEKAVVTLSDSEKEWAKLVSENDVILYLPDIDRKALYHRITPRLREYFENGWREEIDSISQKYGQDVPGLQVMGYKTVQMMLKLYPDAIIPNDQMLDALAQEHRHYAKRQLTWAKRYLKPINDVYPSHLWEPAKMTIRRYSFGGIIQTDDS